MDDLLRLAAQLGRTIAAHERFQTLRRAEDAVAADAATRALLLQRETQMRKIARLEKEQKPVEPEDKHEMLRLNEAVHDNAALQTLARAQADYVEMMRRINDAIQGELAPPAPQ